MSACSGPVKGHKGTAGDGTGDTEEDGGGYVPPDDAAVPPCDDDAGTPGDCVIDVPDAGCGAMIAFCSNARAVLKPGPGSKLVTCLEAATECSENAMRGCAKTALFGACDDPGAEAICAQVASACAATVPVSIKECHNFLDGMLEEGRQRILTCLQGADGGPTCENGVWPCILGL